MRPRSLADAAPELPSKVVAVVDRALSYRKADRWPDMASMRAAWQEAHPHWLPTLPPPSFAADPSFLEASLLVSEPLTARRSAYLFDPRDLLKDSVEPLPKPRVPGAAIVPVGAAPPNASEQPDAARRYTRIMIAIGAVLFLAVSIASAVAIHQ